MPQPLPPTTRRSRALRLSTWAWLGPLLAVGLILAALFGFSLVPYKPFELTGFDVVPNPVCANAPVTGYVHRQFDQTFTYLQLSEAWVTEDVDGYPKGQPLIEETAQLPPAQLHPGGPPVVPSPLLHRAPPIPGTYRIRVITQFNGTRLGFFPAIGSDTFVSPRVFTVTACPPGPVPAPDTSTNPTPSSAPPSSASKKRGS